MKYLKNVTCRSGCPTMTTTVRYATEVRTVGRVTRTAIIIYRPWAPPPTSAGCGLREGPVSSEYSGEDRNLETGHPD
jgi:hypothetical protein